MTATFHLPGSSAFSSEATSLPIRDPEELTEINPRIFGLTVATSLTMFVMSNDVIG
jgi:hypothetical protein